jgi:galactokinase
MLVAIRSNKRGVFRLSSTDKHFKDKRFNLSDFTEEVRELSVSRPGDDEKTRLNREVLRNRRISDYKKFWLAYLDLLQAERKAKRKCEHSSKDWENYVKASVYFYLVRKAYKEKTPLSETSLKGFDLVVSSDIPLAGGASSSSALVVASYIAVRLVDKPQEVDHRFKMETAKHTPLAEWFVGTRGGSMDQATITLGETGRALQMSFGPFAIEKFSIPAKGYKWVTIYTHPHRGGSQIETGYNERSAASLYIIKECIDKVLKNKPPLRRKWEKIKKSVKEKDSGGIEKYAPDMERILDLLPDYVTLAQLGRLVPPEVYKEMGSRYPALFSHPPQKRIRIKKWALHHFEEIRRIFRTTAFLKKAYEAERRGDRRAVDKEMKEVGKKITESGRSLRDNYGLSTPDLDRVIEVALATKGVLGAYIHGGGFGGSALVLVQEDSLEDLIKNETEKYYRKRKKGHREPTRDDIIVADPGEGLSLVDFADLINH